jgi:hypothetical protein
MRKMMPGRAGPIVQISHIILQIQNEKITGTQAKVGRLPALCVGVTVAKGAVRLDIVVNAKVDGQLAVSAA